MKNLLIVSAKTLILFAFFLITSCAKHLKIEINTPNSEDRINELVEIPIEDIQSKLPLRDKETYIIINPQNEEVPSQITYDNKLIFRTDIKGKQNNVYKIIVTTPREYSPKVNGRIYHERKDDMAWENDRVGFRFYNKNLQSEEAPSNALDLWLKRTNNLVLDKWYRENNEGKSYHVDHGEGCDPYAVGRTLGAGAMAPLVNDSVLLNENYVNAEILDNGPLRFTAKLKYPDIEIDGNKYTETRTVSLDAGYQLTKIKQYYSFREPTSVVTGIVKRAAGDSIIWNKENNYFIYQEPEMKDDGQIFIGVFMPQGIDSVYVNSYSYLNPFSKQQQSLSQVLGKTEYLPNRPITYYAGYGWSKFGFSNLNSFENYMDKFSTSLKEPVTIKIK